MSLARRLARSPVLGVALIVALTAAFSAHWTLAIREWGFMTDEMLYVKLALHMGDSLALAPQVRDAAFGQYTIVYPGLLAPLFAIFSVPDAFVAGHLLNSLLIGSSAAPAWLLAREAGARPRGRLAVAALTPLLPWTVMAMFLMTESAAFPVFLWATWLMVRAIAVPGWRREAAAVLAIVVAIFTRSQFVLLLPAFAVAVAWSEAALWRRDRPAPWLLLRRHVVVGTITVGAILLLAGFGSKRLLGNYGGTLRGDLWPPGTFQSVRQHPAILTGLSGILPVLVGLAGTVAAVARPQDRSRHAVAVLALLLTALMVAQSASFNIRSVAGLIQDRYAFYGIPLLMAVGAGWLTSVRSEPRRTWVVPLALSLGFTVYLLQAWTAATGHLYSYAGTFETVLAGRSSELGRALGVHDLKPQTTLTAAAVVVAAVVALALLRPRLRPRATIAAVSALATFLIACTAYDYDKTTAELRAGPPDADWIDRTVPDGARVSIVPAPVTDTDETRRVWWDTEFWNHAVRGMIALEPAWRDSGFPVDEGRLERATGRIVGARASDYVVVPVGDRRFDPVGRTVATTRYLRLVKVDEPLRSVWGVQGLDPHGILATDRPATVRLYPADSGRMPAHVEVDVSPTGAPAAVAYAVSGAGRAKGTVGPQEGKVVVLETCVPAGHAADLRLRIRGAPGATVAVTGVRVTPGGPGCR